MAQKNLTWRKKRGQKLKQKYLINLNKISLSVLSPFIFVKRKIEITEIWKNKIYAEIHERDINTDFVLIVMRDMLATYPDLRVILM